MLHRTKMNQINYQKKLREYQQLTKYLINIFSILNGAKYSSLGIFQNHIVFMPLKNTLNILVDRLDRYLD